jgi:hypothetical protein
MSGRSKPPESSPESNIPLGVVAAWLASELGQGELGPVDPESEVSDQQLQRRLRWAAIRQKNASSESLRTQSRNSRTQVDADVTDRREWTQANIADQKRRTETAMGGLERRDKTTQVERYFWMGVVAIGVLAAIVLAFVTAGQSVWEYRASPAAGLLLSSGGGFQLWSINRSQSDDRHDDDEGKDQSRER